MTTKDNLNSDISISEAYASKMQAYCLDNGIDFELYSKGDLLAVKMLENSFYGVQTITDGNA